MRHQFPVNQYRRLILLLLFSIPFLFTSCSKNPGETPVGPSPIITPKGNATGSPVTATIGAAGGSLTSDDGRISLTVPPGAVSGNTTFSIQPIRNTLDTNMPAPAYRLLPEGLTFTHPVQLSFHYDAQDLDRIPEDLLVAAWQQPDGSWKAVPSALNKTTHTLSLSTTHFSDWLLTGELWLTSVYHALAAGEHSRVMIMGVNHDDEDLLAVLSPSGWSGNISAVRDWKVWEGPGNLGMADGNAGSGNFITAMEYHAPVPVNGPGKAVIAVAVDGKITIPDSLAPGGKREFQQMILTTPIDLVANTYMIGTFGPVDINISDVTALVVNDKINISAHGTNISVGFTTNGTTDSGFPSGDMTIPGNSMTTANYSLNPSTSFSFGSQYQECDPTPHAAYSSGTLVLRKLGGIGEPVEGEFGGLLYTGKGIGPDGCQQYDKQRLTVRFRTIRSL
ncbi:hypothetical protein [Flavihumibacter petaseus]|uniref:ZU5 domain-containing protein n=1 Tax=Flavihumibacter petaseus NBRC 106054 TaxID=1220578 RepID=A0A0E9MY62_9BACT|nr:hypothetical protein [Flavihumibacter petaseus]GAO42524.1 hypothetical protein FPE01S_01_15390 [Flavihumibacter petaseus NBRC 106054]